MFAIACIAFGLCLLLAVSQSIVMAAFLVNLVRNRGVDSESKEAWPQAAVVLALRGPDPFLDDCLHGLLTQQYPQRYTIYLVVDSDTDPVLQDVNAILQRQKPKNVVVSILKNPSPTCSLKCSALIQAVGALDPSYQVVAFLDGDAVPHSTWLVELVGPLSDPAIGVTYGNRWYAPSGHGWGEWIRYCWNVGAVVQVWLNEIIWAGSMALRTDTIRKADLLNAWNQALSVDATVRQQLRRHNYRIRFVPSVILINREAISLRRFIRWVQRQLIAAKSCGPGWRLIGVHAGNLALTQLLALLGLVGGFLMGDLVAVQLCGLGLLAYWGTSLLAIVAADLTIRRQARHRGEMIRWSLLARLQLIPAMLLTQFAYPYALSGAIFRRHIEWRGIEYDIRGVGDVRMKSYLPYEEKQPESVTETVV